MTLTQQQIEAYHRDGYHIARGLWSAEEIAACKAHFDAIAERGEPIENAWDPDLNSTDPLQRYPRIMMPHRFDASSRRMLLDPRIGEVLEALMGEPAIATQSMFYYKPPGGRGQALHQDNYYLRVKPKTCMAAWTAIDRSYPENGGLYVCPGTHMMEVQCPELANPEESFTTHFVRPPAGIQPVPAVLDPGDVLFFNGCVVHGSRPNTSEDWRRSFICHYAPQSAEQLALYYDALRFDGSDYQGFEMTREGGPCGTAFDDGFFPDQWSETEKLGLTPVPHGSIPG